jgi:hypothetical protein
LLLDALVHRLAGLGLAYLFIYGRGYKAFVRKFQGKEQDAPAAIHGLLQDANDNMTRHSPN